MLIILVIIKFLLIKEYDNITKLIAIFTNAIIEEKKSVSNLMIASFAIIAKWDKV